MDEQSDNVTQELGRPLRRAHRADIGLIVGVVFGTPDLAIVRWIDGISFEPIDERPPTS
jgi:hypothetical protein